jgi:hypothetical protein
MAKYHPNIVLNVIDGTWFKSNGKKLKAILKGW